MAVENKYTDANINAAGRVTKLLSMANAGSNLSAAFATFEVAAADSDGSIYRVFKALDPNLIPIAILIGCDSITGGTVWDVGLYAPDLGAVVDADAFAANLDLSTGVDLGFATALDGMDAVAIENYGRKIYEHAGHTVTTKLESYDLALTGDTVGTAAGTVSVLLLYVQG